VLLSLGLDEADSCARIYVFIYSRESFLKVRTKLVKRGIKMVFFEDMFYNLPKGFKVNKVGKTKWIYTIGMVPINEIDLKEEKPIEIKMQKIRKWATCPAKLMFCYVDDAIMGTEKVMFNKKADERVLSVYWFVILVIIAVGVVSGVIHVFGANLDIREAEAGLLRDRIVDCLVHQGNLKSEVYNSLESANDESLLQICNIDINDKTAKYKDAEQQYAIKIDFKEFGNQAFFVACDPKKENVPKCIETTIYVLEEGEKIEGGFLTIKTAVAKIEKNVK